MGKSPEGYIYVYKCVVGTANNICKIGKTRHFKDTQCRIEQSIRTPYYGFFPYMTFEGEPIVTGFKVKDVNAADTKVREYFKKEGKQIGSLEIYDIDYHVAIQKLYELLQEMNLFLELLEDGVIDYGFLVVKEEAVTIDTTKKVFIALRDKILSKYKSNLPKELLEYLRDIKEFQENCSSHYKTGNYVEFKDGLVLDIGISKPKRASLLNKLEKLLGKN